MTGSEVNLNGEWVARDEARISVFDRGFIFGDGVYEVIPAYGRKPFLAERHIDRLERSLGKVGIANPLSRDRWLALISELAQRQDFELQRIYLQVTRGIAPRLHSFPNDVLPTYLLFADEHSRPDRETMLNGFLAITHEDFRWKRCDIKSTSLIAAVLSSEKAVQAGATEMIFLRDGMLTEGASSNVLVVIDGKLFSPCVDNLILGGITLSFIEEVAKDAGHPLTFRDISEQEFRGADEIIISSSGKELVPVTTLDDDSVSGGTAGPVFIDLWDSYCAKTSGG